MASPRKKLTSSDISARLQSLEETDDEDNLEQDAKREDEELINPAEEISPTNSSAGFKEENQEEMLEGEAEVEGELDEKAPSTSAEENIRTSGSQMDERKTLSPGSLRSQRSETPASLPEGEGSQLSRKTSSKERKDSVIVTPRSLQRSQPSVVSPLKSRASQQSKDEDILEERELMEESEQLPSLQRSAGTSMPGSRIPSISQSRPTYSKAVSQTTGFYKTPFQEEEDVDDGTAEREFALEEETEEQISSFTPGSFGPSREFVRTPSTTPSHATKPSRRPSPPPSSFYTAPLMEEDEEDLSAEEREEGDIEEQEPTPSQKSASVKSKRSWIRTPSQLSSHFKTPSTSSSREIQRDRSGDLLEERGQIELIEGSQQEPTPSRRSSMISKPSRSRTPSQGSKYSKIPSPTPSYIGSQREKSEDLIEERSELGLTEGTELTPFHSYPSVESKAPRSRTSSQISKYSKKPTVSPTPSYSGSQRFISPKSVKEETDEEAASLTDSLTGIINRCLQKNQTSEDDFELPCSLTHRPLHDGVSSNLLFDLNNCRRLNADYRSELPTREITTDGFLPGPSNESYRRVNLSLDSEDKKKTEKKYLKLERLITCLVAERNLMKEKLTQAQKEIDVLSGKRIRTGDEDELIKGRTVCIENAFLESQTKILELQREVRCVHSELRHLNEINLQLEMEKENRRRENTDLVQQLNAERKQHKEVKTNLKFAEKQLELNGVHLQRIRTKLACIIHWLHPEPRPSLDILSKENTKVLQCMLEKLIANMDDEVSFLRAKVDEINLENKHLRRAVCLAEDAAKASTSKAEKLEEKLLSIHDSMQTSVTDLSVICDGRDMTQAKLEHLLNRISSQETSSKKNNDRVHELEKKLCYLQNERDAYLNGAIRRRHLSREKLRRTKDKYKQKIKCLVEKLKAAYDQSELLRTLVEAGNCRERPVRDIGPNICEQRAFVPICQEQVSECTCKKTETEQDLKERLELIDKKLNLLNYKTVCSQLTDSDSAKTTIYNKQCLRDNKVLNCDAKIDCPKNNIPALPNDVPECSESSSQRSSEENSESSDLASSEKSSGSLGFEKLAAKCGPVSNSDHVQQLINRAQRWATSVIGRTSTSAPSTGEILPVVHRLPNHAFDTQSPPSLLSSNYYQCTPSSSFPCATPTYCATRDPIVNTNSCSSVPSPFPRGYAASNLQEPSGTTGRCRQSRSQCDYLLNSCPKYCDKKGL